MIETKGDSYLVFKRISCLKRYAQSLDICSFDLTVSILFSIRLSIATLFISILPNYTLGFFWLFCDV